MTTATRPLPGPLLSDRLTLRTWRAEDAELMHRLCQDPEILRWAGLPIPFEPADVLRFIVETLPAMWEAGHRASFAITVTATGEIAGNVGLHAIQPRGADTTASAAIGVWLAAPDRGAGYAREAAARVLAWGFDELGLDRITYHAIAGNTPVRRIARAVGFTAEATLRSAILLDGAPADLWYGDLLPHELIRQPRRD